MTHPSLGEENARHTPQWGRNRGGVVVRHGDADGQGERGATRMLAAGPGVERRAYAPEESVGPAFHAGSGSPDALGGPPGPAPLRPASNAGPTPDSAA